ncbi:TPA: hypothetical protein ACUI23_002415 [Staphylococcus pseudintermedius]
MTLFFSMITVTLYFVIHPQCRICSCTCLEPIPRVEISTESETLKGIRAFIQKDAIPVSFVLLIGMAYSNVLSFLSVYTQKIHLPIVLVFYR